LREKPTESSNNEDHLSSTCHFSCPALPGTR
jgi:hypothetical protein